MQMRRPDAHHGRYEPLSHGEAPCMIQTLQTECQMESVRTVEFNNPRAFPFSKIGAPVASVMITKVATVEWLRSFFGMLSVGTVSANLNVRVDVI